MSFKSEKQTMVRRWRDGKGQLLIPVRQVGRAAMKAAQAEYEKNIEDLPPPEISEESRNAIRKYYREGVEWPDRAKRYFGDGDAEWCGTLPAYCYSRVGDFLLDGMSVDVSVKKPVRVKRFASCYRLWRYKNKYDLEVQPQNLEPGDLVVVGEHPKGHSWGRHITMCDQFNDGDQTFDTVEGNGTGTLPHGRHGEGVVRNERPLSDVTFALRLKPEAYDTPDHIRIVRNDDFKTEVEERHYEQ